MKHLWLSCFCTMWILAGQAQSFLGTWEGLLRTETRNLPILLWVEVSDTAKSGLSIRFQSPRQTTQKFRFQEIDLQGDRFRWYASSSGVTLRGRMNLQDSSLEAIWEQGKTKHAIRLTRYIGESVLARVQRPQTPQAPFPYRVDSVVFPALYSSIQFAGTLTRPTSATGENPVPAVLLLSGSGPSDRDETISGHKPFAVIADALTRVGYVVLRVDDRGTGKSTGKHYPATTYDFSLDAEAAFQYLRGTVGVDSARCGVLGHSEGGLIAAMLAARVPTVSFVISMAGPGAPIIELMGRQNEALLLSRGIKKRAARSYRSWYESALPAVLQAPDSVQARMQLTAQFDTWRNSRKPAEVEQMTGVTNAATLRSFLVPLLQLRNNVWFRYFLETDPKEFWEKVRVPVLAINGTKDIQVDADQNLEAIQRILRNSGNTQFEIVSLGGLNHLLQRCQFCTVEEYSDLEQTIDPAFLEAVIGWMKRKL